MKDTEKAYPNPIAFSPFGDVHYSMENGMNIRDVFAGQIGAAILGGMISAEMPTNKEDADKIAESAYHLADALMRARSK